MKSLLLFIIDTHKSNQLFIIIFFLFCNIKETVCKIVISKCANASVLMATSVSKYGHTVLYCTRFLYKMQGEIHQILDTIHNHH